MSDERVVPLPGRRMTDDEFDAEFQKIMATYGNSRKEAGDRWEQELAKFLYRSGWTQEKLAEKIGHTQSYIAKMLRFGRYLNFSPVGLNPGSLNERQFRRAWEESPDFGGNERQRFMAVQEALERNHAAAKQKRTPGASKAIRERFADGRWHSLGRIQSTLADFPPDTIAGLLSRENAISGVRREQRRRAQDIEYRLFPREKQVSSLELSEKLGPLVKQLREQGRKNAATIAISLIASIASQLDSLLDEWTR